MEIKNDKNKKSIGLKPEVFFKPQIWKNRPKGRSILRNQRFLGHPNFTIWSKPNLSNEKNFRIREVKIEDLQNLLDLLHQLSPLSETEKINIESFEQILQKIIKDENHYICVFEFENKLFGTGTLLIQRNLSHGGRAYAHIENVVVDKEHRKKGIGKEIINHLIEKAKENKCHKILLNCKKHNTHFYAKHGLQESGEVEMRLNYLESFEENDKSNNL